MKVLGVIPVRMDSTRFPNKPLALIKEIAMLGHVYYRSIMTKKIDKLYIATCDQELVDYTHSIGGNAILTSDVHERASERTAEALLKIEQIENEKYDRIIMIQGDEPLLQPEMLDVLISEFDNSPGFDCYNLMVKLNTNEEIIDPNNVKVVTNSNGKALYFSRSPIPSNTKYNKPFPSYMQLGLIAFSRASLIEFVNLKPTILEIIESVDLNRFLENNLTIKMIETSFRSIGVDTPSDLEQAQELMNSDNLYNLYK
jgi:3-deoxy-manno-octulosonate cytidylyltransferase (CMP-KDO synthetase)